MTIDRVIALFEALCDASDVDVRRALAREPEAVRAQVLQMLAADRSPALLPADDEVAWAVARDLLDELSDLPKEWTPPRFLPNLELTRELGRGGMGVVFEARQLQPPRDVAVKFMGPAYRQAAEEARALAALRHPAIPIVYEVGELEGVVYLVMERVHGASLLVWAEGQPLERRLQVFLSLCDAVEHAHAAGILHRDIKPSNVLVERDRAWVLDFGLALSEGGAGAEGVMGTLPYIADEVLGGSPATQASDVFSLGVLLAELVGGPRPTRGSRGSASAQRRMRLRNPPWMWSEHPVAEVNSIVRRALRPLGDRYPTVAALADDVRRFLAHRPMVAHDGGWAYRTRLWMRRRPGVVLLTAGVLVALAAVAYPRLRAVQEEYGRRVRAERWLAGIDEELSERLERGDIDGAREQLAGALLEPGIRRTPAAAEALYRLGTALLERGHLEASTASLAEAYVETSVREQRDRTAAALARALQQRRSWEGLAVLAERLPEPLRSRLGFEAAVAQRQIHPELFRDRPRWAFLGEAERQPYRPTSLVVTAHGVQLMEHDRQRLVITDRALQLRHEVPVVSTGASVPARGAVPASTQLWVWSGADGYPGLWAVGPDGVPALVAALPAPGEALSAATLPGVGSDAGTALVGMGPPFRALYGVDLGTGRLFEPDAAITALASDLNELIPHPVDGDAPSELTILQGPWRAYDLRRYTVGEAGLQGGQRLRLGGYARGALFDRPDGRWLLLVKSDLYPQPELFGGDGFGIASGIYGLQEVDGRWQPRWHHPLPGHWKAGMALQVGDFDGDGWQDVAIRLGDPGHALILLLGAHGIEDEVWIRGVIPMGATDVDGDGDDELLVRLPDDDEQLWVLGAGEGSLPPLVTRDAAGRLLNERPQVLGPARELVEIGLLDEALGPLERLARASRDPAMAVERWRATARLAQAVGRPELAERALREALLAAPGRASLYAELEEVLAARHHRHLAPTPADAVAPTVFDFQRGLPPIEVLEPQALELDGAGLAVRVVGPDGVLLRAPLRVDEPDRLAVEVDLDLHHAELGVRLEVALVDARGDAVLGVGVLPYGGGRGLDRLVRCHSTLMADHVRHYGGYRPQEVRTEQLALRISHDGDDVLCGVHRDGVLRVESKLPALGRPVGELTLLVRASHEPNYASSFLYATVRRITVRGVTALPIRESAGRLWLQGERRAAAKALESTRHGPALAARLGDVNRARALSDQLTPAMWIGAMRRSPQVWLPALAVAPEQLARRYAAAWGEAHRVAPWPIAEEALGHPMVDQLPIADETVRSMLLHRANALLEDGAHDRALGLLERVLEETEPTDALELAAARALVGLRRQEEGRRRCERALALAPAPQRIHDAVAADPALAQLCGDQQGSALLTVGEPPR